ncbi:unnamed protein product [Mesocestoides corti]|uniref:Origin recognition complex subunit 3 N-terminal domain-containing protein n=1 Tax=Mesocestoides corti TaxID=53468 RepID=A0A0R3U821_MESCO|nr:unnamed protein product [Mesocestoides corti]
MSGIKVCTKRGEVPTRKDPVHDAFSHDWNTISNIIERRIINLSNQNCVEVAKYINTMYETCMKTPSTGQIPTALLLASVNTPDNDSLFAQLKKLLVTKGGHVAVIDTGSNTSSARHIITSAVQQFTTRKDLSVGDGVDTTPPSNKGSPPNGFSDLDTQVTSDLVEGVKSLSLNTPRKISPKQSENTPVRQTPHSRASYHPARTAGPRSVARRGRRMTGMPGRSTPKSPATPKASAHPIKTRSGPLVIIIPAVEAISAPVLRDFIHITSIYLNSAQKRLPVCFVFGVSSTADLGFESRCDAQTLSRLAIKRFHMPPPSVFLQAALTELLHVPGFRASRGLMSFLIDSLYNCLDYSIEHLLKRYKLAMLTHYLTLPHAKLLAPLREAKAYVESLGDGEIARLLSMYPSLSHLKNSSNENKENEEAVSEGGEKPQTRDVLCEMLKRHWLTQLILPPILNWLLALFEHLSIRPMGSNLTDLYREWLSARLVNEGTFAQTVKLFKALDRTQVMASIDASIGNLQASMGVLVVAKSTIPPSDASPVAPTGTTRRRSLVEGVAGGACVLEDYRWKACLSEALEVLAHFKATVTDWRHRLATVSSQGE